MCAKDFSDLGPRMSSGKLQVKEVNPESLILVLTERETKRQGQRLASSFPSRTAEFTNCRVVGLLV